MSPRTAVMSHRNGGSWALTFTFPGFQSQLLEYIVIAINPDRARNSAVENPASKRTEYGSLSHLIRRRAATFLFQQAAENLNELRRVSNFWDYFILACEQAERRLEAQARSVSDRELLYWNGYRVEETSANCRRSKRVVLADLPLGIASLARLGWLSFIPFVKIWHGFWNYLSFGYRPAWDVGSPRRR
jgi:hypothetical protein